MVKPVRFEPPPKPAAEVQNRIVALLEDTLFEAKRGEISSLLMVVGFADGTWQERISATLSKSRMIGQCFVAMTNWALHYDES